MNISRIADIQADGTYNGNYGLLYQFLVTFEDGFTGQANAKSERPPYGLGDEVAYEVTGSYPKGQKIKITKDLSKVGNVPRPAAPPPPPRPPAPARPGAPARPIAPPAPQNRSNAPAGASGINGSTVGMAVKLAGDIILHNSNGGTVDYSTLQARLVDIASEIIRASQTLEAGNLSPDTSDVPY